MRGVLMWSMTGSDIQDPSLRRFAESTSKVKFPTAYRTA